LKYLGDYLNHTRTIEGTTEMPQKTRPPKNMLLATRITPKVRDSVVQLAQGEGLNVSEWLRNLITMELKRADVLPSVHNGPNLCMELNDNE
jgi:hypothetical protein